MQLMPVLKFWFTHGQQIEGLVDKGNTPGQAHTIIGIVEAIMPFAKRAWPILTQDNLADDFVAMLKDMLTP